MNAIVDSPLTIDVHVHGTSDSASKLVESSVSIQISRYSFVTSLIEDKTVDSSIVTSSRLSEFPRADYDFMVVSTE